jgi:hypothetical protein
LGSADDRLHSRIHGLERHRPVQSQLLARLAWNLKTLFGLAAVDLPAYHYTLAPTELVVDLTRMKKAVQAIPSERWRPADLPAALAYLPGLPFAALYSVVLAVVVGSAEPVVFETASSWWCSGWRSPWCFLLKCSSFIGSSIVILQ